VVAIAVALARQRVYACGKVGARLSAYLEGAATMNLFNAPLRFCSSALITAAILVVPAVAQATLYDNGPDGDIGYYHVNFGAAVSNSFMLPQPAQVASVTLTLYDVDDRNQPEQLKWKITTEPLGGAMLASGFAPLTVLRPPYLTQFLFFAWDVSFAIPGLNLAAGTYYLQIQDVVTQWDTWAFWAESSDGASQGYYQSVGPIGDAIVSPVPSESFSVLGEWKDASAH
jgi:hypothetical protein